MLRPRIIPCLLIQDGGLVKTKGFGDPTYVGDPLNAVRIFNEKQVDELIVLEIDATAKGRPPNLSLIQRLAAECRMPLCYGGGVTRAEEIENIVAVGVEKVALSSALFSHPSLLAESSRRVGQQSLVAVLDVRRLNDRYEVFIGNGKVATGAEAAAFAQHCVASGAGEIVINSIDRDGTMEGYDFDLVAKIRAAVKTPLTVLGGAASVDDMRRLVERFGILGAAAGSLFVFKGPRRAVLINYPRMEQRIGLLPAGLPS
jgi:cyclase